MDIEVVDSHLVVSFNTHSDSKYLPFSVHFSIDITTYPFGNLGYFISLPEEQQTECNQDQILDDLQHGTNAGKIRQIIDSFAPPKCTFGRVENICNFLTDLLQ